MFSLFGNLSAPAKTVLHAIDCCFKNKIPANQNQPI
jgi:hypothetical protein